MRRILIRIKSWPVHKFWTLPNWIIYVTKNSRGKAIWLVSESPGNMFHLGKVPVTLPGSNIIITVWRIVRTKKKSVLREVSLFVGWGGAPPGGRTTLDVLRMGGELFWTSRQGGANIFGLPKTQFFHVLWVFWALLIFVKWGGAKILDASRRGPNNFGSAI